jgi:dihydroneopterin aldolase
MAREPDSLANRYFAPGHFESEAPADRILVRDLVLDFSIGVYEHEKQVAQRVRVNVEIEVEAGVAPNRDDIEEVVSYEHVVTGIKALAAGEHIHLVETLAERVADICLADARAKTARVRVEKLDVEPAAQAVGVEIERRRTWSGGRQLQSAERRGQGQSSVIRAFEPRPTRERGGADD